MSFVYGPVFYVITIILQIICAIHCVRRGNYIWLWLIILLPMLGCAIYFFSEMLNPRQISKVQSGVKTVLVPGITIKKLEDQLKFSDTFNNRVLLADAYLAAGQSAKAVAIYEKSLTGAFEENEHGLMQLIHAYHELGRHEDVLKVARKMYGKPQFARSKANLLYAMSLEKTGRKLEAEEEFRRNSAKFSNYENRYEFGLFLARENRVSEAIQLFDGMLAEKEHLNGREKSENRQWFAKSKDALRKLKEMAV